MGKKSAIGALAAVLIGMFLIVIAQTGVGVNLFGGPAAAAPTASSKCATAVAFRAYTAPAGSNNFGAAVNPATAAAGVELANADFCVDPLEFATDEAYAKSGLNLDAAAAQSQAKYYVQHPKVWAANVVKFFKTAQSWTLVNDQHKYYSIGMKTGANKNVMPVLVRGSEPVNIGMALTFKYNGVTRELRLACRFQPVEHQPFVHVPATPATPVAKCTSTDCGHTTTCTTCGQPSCTSGCTTSTPGCVQPPSPGSHWIWHPELCKWVYCGCVSKAQVQIPVQEPGYPTVANSSAPAARPSAQPTVPVNVTSPAAPRSSGYNGGSTSNPIVTGTPPTGDTGTHGAAPSPGASCDPFNPKYPNC